MSVRLFRIILPVSNIDQAERFYSQMLNIPGKRISSGRHYFDCGGTILACFDPKADGDGFDASPNPDHVYFAVEVLEKVYDRAINAGCLSLRGIELQPWGERSFYAVDPFGNPICFVDDQTLFTGK